MHSINRIILFLLIFCCVACATDDECRQEYNVHLKAALYTTKYDTDKDINVAVKHTPDSISVWGVGQDSILYNKAKTNTLSFPLNKNAERSSFVIKYDYTSDDLNQVSGQDTIEIYYENSNNFISLECGCFVYHTLRDFQIIGQVIDSIAITNQQVTNVNEEHIQIFF